MCLLWTCSVMKTWDYSVPFAMTRRWKPSLIIWSLSVLHSILRYTGDNTILYKWSTINIYILTFLTKFFVSFFFFLSQQLETSRSQRPCSPFVFVCICIVFGIAVVIAICFSIYMNKWQNHITPTLQPYTTINSATGNTTYFWFLYISYS